MTRTERILYHQIHPAKLATDVTAAVISLYFFWQHRFWPAVALHFVPPVVASAWLMEFGDLDRESALGAYVARTMSRSVEAVRLGGDIIMVFGAWCHFVVSIVTGLAIILAGWLSGLTRKQLP